MAKVTETMIAELGYDETIFAFRKACLSLGTVQEVEEGHFRIKETENGYSGGTITSTSEGGIAFSTNKTYWPATVNIYFRNIALAKTEITLTASEYGFGSGHAKSKLSTVKSAIIVAVSEQAKQVPAQAPRPSLSLEKQSASPSLSLEKPGTSPSPSPEAPRPAEYRPVITTVPARRNNSSQAAQSDLLVILSCVFIMVAVFFDHISFFYSPAFNILSIIGYIAALVTGIMLLAKHASSGGAAKWLSITITAVAGWSLLNIIIGIIRNGIYYII